MNKRIQNVFTTVRAMSAVLNGEVGAATGTGVVIARRRLDQAADRIAALDTEQRGAVRALAVLAPRLRALRKELRTDHMQPIIAIAKRELGEETGLGFLRVPRGTATTMELIMAARVMAQSVAPYSFAFVKTGMPVNFVEQIRLLSVSLEDAQVERYRQRVVRKAATEGLAAMEREGRGLIRIVDALVRRRIRSQPAVLARWEWASCVAGSQGGRRRRRGAVRTGDAA